jgi:anti-anti-sigma regulatory factor
MRRREDGWLIKVRGGPGGVFLRVVAPRVPLDGANAQVLLSYLAPLVNAGGRCRLTVVLGNVIAVSGVALRELARLHEQLRAGGGCLTLSDAPESVHEEVEALRLTPALSIRRRGRGGRPRRCRREEAGGPADGWLARPP